MALSLFGENIRGNLYSRIRGFWTRFAFFHFFLEGGEMISTVYMMSRGEPGSLDVFLNVACWGGMGRLNCL